MKNLSKLEYPDMYQHWYQGYTKIFLPSFFDGYMVWDGVIMEKQLLYYIYTSAPSGNISTQYFGDEFDADKLQSNYEIEVYIYVPENAQNNKNVTFMLKIDQEFMDNKDELRFGTGFGGEKIVSKVFSKNFSSPNSDYALRFKRFEIGNINGKENQKMPGFRVSWKYDTDVVAEAMYMNDKKTLEFVR